MSYSRSYSDRVEYPFKSDSPLGTQDGSFFLTLTGTRSGSAVPYWKQKIRNGSDATSSFTVDRTGEGQSSAGSAYLWYHTTASPFTKYVDTHSGFENPALTISHLPVDSSKADNDALTSIYDRIRAQRQTMNSLAFLGELRESIHMLRHPYASMVDLINNHVNRLSKRGRGLKISSAKDRKSLLRIVADTWIETQFGLKPLISDTRDIATAIARANDSAPLRGKAFARATQSARDVTGPSLVVSYKSRMVYRRTVVTTTEYSSQWVVGLSVSQAAASGSIDALRETLGFNLQNFIPALYEILPWSWFVDYFTNTGSILEAATTSTSNVLYSVKTTRLKTRVLCTNPIYPDGCRDYLKSFGYTLDAVGGHFGTNALIRTTIARTRSPLGIPSFEVSAPSSLGKLANIAAVAIQHGRSFRF